MKVVILGAANSIHVSRWANGLAQRGMAVHVITLHRATQAYHPSVTVHQLPVRLPLGYVSAASQLRRLLRVIGPDLLNVHYASGYGLLGRLCGFSPMLLSVWGSDVYEFPRTSFLHRHLLRANLRHATLIASTSVAMRGWVEELLPDAPVMVTPFGVDPARFHVEPAASGRERLVVGTVKTLAEKYRIDVLIQAFARVHAQLHPRAVSLEITGGGPLLAKLKALAQDLGLSSAITFHGPVPHEQVASMLQRLDVFVALSSESESFGVAIVEAQMAGIPVVVSNAPGLTEVVEDGVTGVVVPMDDADAAAEAILTLLKSDSRRREMGQAGRRRALMHYSWEQSLDTMIAAYERTISMGHVQDV